MREFEFTNENIKKRLLERCPNTPHIEMWKPICPIEYTAWFFIKKILWTLVIGIFLFAPFVQNDAVSEKRNEAFLFCSILFGIPLATFVIIVIIAALKAKSKFKKDQQKYEEEVQNYEKAVLVAAQELEERKTKYLSALENNDIYINKITVDTLKHEQDSDGAWESYHINGYEVERKTFYLAQQGDVIYSCGVTNFNELLLLQKKNDPNKVYEFSLVDRFLSKNQLNAIRKNIERRKFFGLGQFFKDT